MSLDDLMGEDDDSVKDKDSEGTSYIDPLIVDEEEEEEEEMEEEEQEEEEEEVVVEKAVKKQTISTLAREDHRNTTQSGSKSIIVASTNSNVIQNKVIATTTSSGFVKIAPRSSANTVATSPTITTNSNTAAAARTSNGKIFYLQRQSGGSSVPMRVPATNATASNPSKTVAIHVIRASDGSLVPVKGGKSINIPNVSQLAGKKIIATTGSGSGSQVLIKAPTKTISGPITPGSSTTTTSSSGATVISSVEIAKPTVRPVIAGKSVLANSSNGSTSGSGKMLMQGTRQVMVSQNVIKLSPNTTSGQLQAIHMPGKTGLQYVRVLNNTSAITHKVASSETTTTPKYTVVRQNKPPMKIMVKSPLNDRDRQKMMGTVPTLRKINEVMIKPQEGNEGGGITRPHKISQINSEIQRFSNSGDTRTVAPGSKYIVVSKSLIRSTVTSQNQKIIQQRQSLIDSRQDAAAGPQSPPPAKKLYSVLKPDMEHKEVKLKARAEPVPLKPKAPTLTSTSAAVRSSRAPSPPSDDSIVPIRRKHCNCTKSQCLKLYCDCFANGEFCQDCNCKDCLNNLDNEDERQKAIRICLERNPNSFKPKITAATNESDQRLHNKGCNCKRSGCLKNYCECYEAKIPCSSNCKCVGCRNVEDQPDLDMDLKKCPILSQPNIRVKRSFDDMAKSRPSTLQSLTSSAQTSVSAAVSAAAVGTSTACGPTAEKQPCNFITQEVVDATIQCLIAQADECKKGSLTPYQTEKMVMEELGRCLVEIIDFSIRNTDQN